MSAIAIKVLVSVLGMVMIAGGAWYVVDLIQDNAILEASNKGYEDDINGYKVAQDTLMDAYTENYDEKAKLETMLAEHDLGELAKRKPGLVADRINSGTSSLFGAIEAASRAPKADKASPDSH